MSSGEKRTGLTYSGAGVDIDAANRAKRRIKELARSTFNRSVLTEIGSFAGVFRPELKGIEQPVLLASADGVGTKLKIAFMTGIHDTVGIDIVSHCTDDILVLGALPLFFLDYIATRRLEPEVIEQIVKGLAEGCRQSECVLLGGETAEMPDFYQPGEYDLAGIPRMAGKLTNRSHSTPFPETRNPTEPSYAPAVGLRIVRFGQRSLVVAGDALMPRIESRIVRNGGEARSLASHVVGVVRCLEIREFIR